MKLKNVLKWGYSKARVRQTGGFLLIIALLNNTKKWFIHCVSTDLEITVKNRKGKSHVENYYKIKRSSFVLRKLIFPRGSFLAFFFLFLFYFESFFCLFFGVEIVIRYHKRVLQSYKSSWWYKWLLEKTITLVQLLIFT